MQTDFIRMCVISAAHAAAAAATTIAVDACQVSRLGKSTTGAANVLFLFFHRRRCRRLKKGKLCFGHIKHSLHEANFLPQLLPVFARQPLVVGWPRFYWSSGIGSSKLMFGKNSKLIRVLGRWCLALILTVFNHFKLV